MGTFPGLLDEAVAAQIAARQTGRLSAGAARLTARYRAGKASQGVDLSAYLAARLPATFAVNQRVLSEVAAVVPAFQPGSVADLGAGPGTSGWAAATAFATVAQVTQVELAADFVGLLRGLNAASGVPALSSAEVVETEAALWKPATRHDLVVASYMLAEMPVASVSRAVLNAWDGTAGVLVLIEPGTPEGHARLMAAREALLKAGAHIAGPCTHHAACPLAKGDWCHFKTRVQRSRLHMQAKQAIVPFEDEAYGWLAVSRLPVALPQGRIIAPVKQNKTGLDLHVCAEGAVKTLHVASRDKATYKRLRKCGWGDALPAAEPGDEA